MHCTTRSLLSGIFNNSSYRATSSLPAFLVPAFAVPQSSPFSTTSVNEARKDGNRSRGVSALRRTGLGKSQGVSVKFKDLPKPSHPSERSIVEVDENHGLWEFFPEDRKSMATPEEMNAHGRAWTMQELRNKDWEDLHKLWWVCIKEMNRLNTYENERERIGNMHGAYESKKRMGVIRHTMRAIKATLTERWYTWENARNEAMHDSEINMYADLDAGEAAYLPRGDDYEAADQLEEQTASQTDSALPPPVNQQVSPEARAQRLAMTVD